MASSPALFLKEFSRTHRTTGAIAPSSRLLAGALTRYLIPSPGHPRSILEVGPGTGAVTRRIQASLGPLDSLRLIEANPRFADLLQHEYGADPRVTLSTGLVQDQELGGYDTIVCGLPFANFEAETTEQIFDRLLATLHPGGTLSFFGYAAFPALRQMLGTRTAQSSTEALDRILRRHRFRRETVLANLPPAHVHHLAPAEPSAHTAHMSAASRR